MTARAYVSSTSSGDVCGIITPSLNKPIFPTTDLLVLVAGNRFLFLITNRGFMYSPTRNQKKAASTRQPFLRISGSVDVLLFV